MNAKRVYFLMLSLVVVLLVGIGGGTYGVNVLLEKQSTHLVSLKAQSKQLNDEQIGLAKEKKEVTQYANLNTIAKSIVPQDKDQAEAVQQIVNIANNNKIKLANISFPSSNLGAVTAPKTTTTTTPSNPSASSALTQVTPVVGIQGVYNLQITLQSDTNAPVSYAQFISFLQGLENNRRTAQVSSIAISPVPANRSLLTFTLIINEYVKP